MVKTKPTKLKKVNLAYHWLKEEDEHVEVDDLTKLAASQPIMKRYNKYKDNKNFIKEYSYLAKNFIGRPTPLYYAENLTKYLDLRRSEKKIENTPRTRKKIENIEKHRKT